MAALTVDRNTDEREGKSYEYPVEANTEIFAGSLVVLNASGNAEPATQATGKIAVGRAEEHIDNNPGAAAAKTIKVKAGVFRWVNGETITKVHIGDQAYANDDQTVYRTATGRSPVGAIVDVDSEGVWVKTDVPLLAASTGLLAANNLADLGTVATARTNLGLTDSSADLDLDTVTYRNKLVAGGAAYTVGSAADGDAIIQTATDTAVITLPDAAAANAGKRITVQNTAADGAALISVSPHASDFIKGGIHGAAGGDLVSFSGTLDKDIQNTKATQKQGDYAVLVSDGATGWWVIGGKGVWASQA